MRDLEFQLSSMQAQLLSAQKAHDDDQAAAAEELRALRASCREHESRADAAVAAASMSERAASLAKAAAESEAAARKDLDVELAALMASQRTMRDTFRGHFEQQVGTLFSFFLFPFFSFFFMLLLLFLKLYYYFCFA